jgi:hypothetical protein
MAYIKVDGKKYFDYRYIKPYKLCILDNNTLPSNFKHRRDLQLLDIGKIDES